MKNQKVSTAVGAGILIIFSITVFTFVWKYEESLPRIDDTASIVPMSVLTKVQEPTTAQIFPKTIEPMEERKAYRNGTYDFEIQYPSNYLFDESFSKEGDVKYSLGFGPSYEEVFGEKHSNRKSSAVFEVSIFENNTSLDSFVKKTESMLGGIEHTLEIVGTERVAGISAKVARVCNMGGYCDKKLYFIHGEYLYVIDMDNYFGLENEVIKNGLDRMLASFSFSTK